MCGGVRERCCLAGVVKAGGRTFSHFGQVTVDLKSPWKRSAMVESLRCLCRCSTSAATSASGSPSSPSFLGMYLRRVVWLGG